MSNTSRRLTAMFLVVMMGSVAFAGAASAAPRVNPAAPTVSEVAAAPQAAALPALGSEPRGKYIKCIAGIGVPIAVAVGLAIFSPATLSAISARLRSAPPGVVGLFARLYGGVIGRACVNAFLGR